MASLEIEMARAKANGDKKVVNFTGGVRSLENVALEEGDEWTFPETFEVYEQKIGTSTAQYIWITLADGNAKRFYPSTFTKSRTVYDEDGTSTGERVHTLGTAADEFRKHGSIKDGMEAMKGKKVKVTALASIRTLRFGTTELMTTQIPTIDFVEDKKK